MTSTEKKKKKKKKALYFATQTMNKTLSLLQPAPNAVSVLWSSENSQFQKCSIIQRLIPAEKRNAPTRVCPRDGRGDAEWMKELKYGAPAPSGEENQHLQYRARDAKQIQWGDYQGGTQSMASGLSSER